MTTKKDEVLETFRQGFDDIPAMVGTGLPQLRRARYLLVHVDDARAARAWLRQLLASDVVHSLARVRAKSPPKKAKGDAGAAPRKPSRDVTQLVTVAFSHAGLAALGLREDERFPFPTPFRAGGASALRRKLLGDADQPAWQWGDVGNGSGFEAHIFIAHYWSEKEGSEPLALLDPACLPAGLSALSVASCPSYIASPDAPEPAVFEPFGFRDGIGQPVIEGMGLSTAEKKAREASGRLFDDRLIQPGEFVLGQVNEYGERAYCPNVEGWPREASAESGFGRNGTYLAVRQIEQHVAVFNQFTSGHAVPMVGNRMVGRRKPDPACPQEAGYSVLDSARPPSEIDAFRYLTLDANGLECPRGAHARRANPRDALALGVSDGIVGSKLHRLLRRGRVYAEGCTQGSSTEEACAGHAAGRAGDTPCGRGLMFVALNTDFERQFEFVQKSWIAGSRFGDLSDEQDPLLGTDPKRTFTVQGCPVGERVGPLPRFTTVLGGGYFFAPSLTALRWLAEEKELAALQPA